METPGTVHTTVGTGVQKPGMLGKLGPYVPHYLKPADFDHRIVKGSGEWIVLKLQQSPVFYEFAYFEEGDDAETLVGIKVERAVLTCEEPSLLFHFMKRMTEAQSEIPETEAKPPTELFRSVSSPGTKSPQSSLPSNRKTSKKEKTNKADSFRDGSSSGTFPRSRRTSKFRKTSLVLPSLFPDPSMLDPVKTFRRSSISAPTRKLSRMSSSSGVDPTTLDPQKLSPNSSISTPSSSPKEIPMKFMSIDLERELPEIFSTSLNPALQDPDMSEFYSRVKSPPPIYGNRKVSMLSSAPSYTPRKVTRGIQVETETRMKLWLALFVLVFFLFPIAILIIFRVIPAFVAYIDGNNEFTAGAEV
ncbi:hypothetical protein RB195_012261 [Necator americanus]|uniref:Uncharacterized protein n=1 Tax=Necator americanus TaxID=51031 RepID=A0ABR1D6Z9_NECAM